MATLRFLERLRAIRRNPDRRDFDDIHDVLHSVIGHVGKLLNTRRGSTVLDENFGIPDFTAIGVSYSRDDIPRFEKEMSEFIERCENRLHNVRMTYTPHPDAPFSVDFILNAELETAENVILPITLKTRVDTSGKVSVSE